VGERVRQGRGGALLGLGRVVAVALALHLSVFLPVCTQCACVCARGRVFLSCVCVCSGHASHACSVFVGSALFFTRAILELY